MLHAAVMRGMSALASVLATLGFAPVMSAAQLEILLQYDADTGCPDRAFFEAQVAARTLRVAFVTAATEPRKLRVTARRDGESAAGELTLSTDDETKSTPRRVSADSCEQVVRALAFIAAVAIDPESATATDPVVESAPSMPIQDDSAAPAPASGNANPAVLLPPAPASRPVAAAVLVPQGARRGQSARFEIGLGAESRTTLGALGLPLFGGSLWGGIDQPSDSAWRLNARLALLAAASPALDAEAPGSGFAHFELFAARASVCPLALDFSRRARARPCLGFEGGRIFGTGVAGPALPNVGSRSAAWFAVGQALRLEFQAAGALRLELDTGLNQLVTRSRFVFQENSQVVVARSTPRLQGSLAIGVSWSFL